ncbi:MAG: Large-conductance mechanosensitive channel [candidate division WS6 bacterium 36_33]|uniref:Large-conductance mechanosensitive channel n=1 Tax=candidate division WS6 bacterium 36_33 TaxID=1641388 RepID=A0A117LTY2_9BACT|nr:MAG: Large-conductance mechanosensitive channel [candidate division WS6 bacterium 36_33]
MKKKKSEKRWDNIKKEFKEFAFKEATFGAAIGIMIGAALKDVINSLVTDILTPPINFLTSGVDFTNLYFVLGKGQYESLSSAEEAGAVVIRYGNFLNEFISFLITAIILFVLTYQITKLLSKAKKEEEMKK